MVLSETRISLRKLLGQESKRKCPIHRKTALWLLAAVGAIDHVFRHLFPKGKPQTLVTPDLKCRGVVQVVEGSLNTLLIAYTNSHDTLVKITSPEQPKMSGSSES